MVCLPFSVVWRAFDGPASDSQPRTAHGELPALLVERLPGEAAQFVTARLANYYEK